MLVCMNKMRWKCTPAGPEAERRVGGANWLSLIAWLLLLSRPASQVYGVPRDPNALDPDGVAMM